MDLFTSTHSAMGMRGVPLAARMRPTRVDEVVGQEHILAQSSPLRAVLSANRTSTSVILWGPPGTGKTTLARVIANSAGARFEELTAVSATVKDVRAVIHSARVRKETGGSATVLFVDEVHRFSKTQQDAMLPAVENGWITLVGATTENPSFSVIPALLSRSLVLPLHPLADEDLSALVDRAIEVEHGLAGDVRIDEDARNHLIRLAGGDARRALTLLEAAAIAVLAGVDESAVPERADSSLHEVVDSSLNEAGTSARGPFDEPAAQRDSEVSERGGAKSAEAVLAAVGPFDQAVPQQDTAGEPENAGQDELGPCDDSVGGSTDRVPTITLADIEAAAMHSAPRYDRAGDRHYDVTSALIKSLRGSDVDAAMHYLAIMIEAGEDPRFIARRLMILASEDVGMADPSALSVAVAAHTAVSTIGMPEARIILAQAVVHLALAPKSNAAYRAINSALADVRAGVTGPVPDHLRDASSKSARADGAGKGYRYPHDEEMGVSAQQYAPDAAAQAIYYRPTTHGAEARAFEAVQRLRAILSGRRTPPGQSE